MYDYEMEKKKLFQRNLDELEREIFMEPLPENLNTKIVNFSNNFDFYEKEVIEKIKRDRMFAANFIKSPSRQNFYETEALVFLNSMESVEKAEKLPASGAGAFYVVNGILSHERPDKTYKSIDFRIKMKNGKVIYATHKYTKDEGGAQDNQKNDLLQFIQNARKYRKGEIVFAVIADGTYYDRHGREELEMEASGSEVVVCSMESFEEVVNG